MTARTLMIQGTASSVGKSLVVAGICRALARRGVRVAPFKSQNMSLNAAATPEGDEIGRAQAMQALAAGIPPHVDMNPILLKPEGQMRSQVISQGKVLGTMTARAYEQEKARLFPGVLAALDRLRAAYDVVIIEGAGSPAEINLNAHEIVNMRVARAADAPVVLIGDIDRGGVFASLVGTLALLEPADRERVAGLVINKLRGDPALLGDGVEQLHRLTGKPTFGVVPWLADVRLPEEDSATLPRPTASLAPAPAGMLDIAVIALPLLANYDDLDPLAAEPGVRVRYVAEADVLGHPQVILLPGTKVTLAALRFLDETGLGPRIVQQAHQGTTVVGLCGGYQLLGHGIADPDQHESEQIWGMGLGLLPIGTTLTGEKAVRQTQARIQAQMGMWAALQGMCVSGYEIHTGQSAAVGEEPVFPLLRVITAETTTHEGAVAAEGHIWGTYLHGIFTETAFRQAWLAALRSHYHLPVMPPIASLAPDPFDHVADHLEQHLTAAFWDLLGIEIPSRDAL